MRWLLLAAMSSAYTRSELADHLLAQRAPRAAARLRGLSGGASAPESVRSPPPRAAPVLYAVAPSEILLVDDAPSCDAFVAALAAADTLALDAEWEPDSGPSDHPASLLQLALAASADGGLAATTFGRVALLDLPHLAALDREGAAGASARAALDAALGACAAHLEATRAPWFSGEAPGHADAWICTKARERSVSLRGTFPLSLTARADPRPSSTCSRPPARTSKASTSPPPPPPPPRRTPA